MDQYRDCPNHWVKRSIFRLLTRVWILRRCCAEDVNFPLWRRGQRAMPRWTTAPSNFYLQSSWNLQMRPLVLHDGSQLRIYVPIYLLWPCFGFLNVEILAFSPTVSSKIAPASEMPQEQGGAWLGGAWGDLGPGRTRDQCDLPETWRSLLCVLQLHWDLYGFVIYIYICIYIYVYICEVDTS